jgi:uncharacterized protein (UPF0548 family)
LPVTATPAALADRLRAEDLAYAEVGVTAGVLPSGYHDVRRTAVIGSGALASTAAADASASWQVHAQAGLHVWRSTAAAEPGTVLMLAFGPRAVRIRAPCRVVHVIDEPARRGFAYGTPPGHPERGEEGFVLCQHQDATVTFTITACSPPASLLSMVAGLSAGPFSTASPLATCTPFSPGSALAAPPEGQTRPAGLPKRPGPLRPGRTA